MGVRHLAGCPTNGAVLRTASVELLITPARTQELRHLLCERRLRRIPDLRAGSAVLVIDPYGEVPGRR